MKISMIGPGIMPIPPTDWGGVEIFIWDCKNALEKLGHEIQIVNTKNVNKIIKEVNSFEPDFVHLHYDQYCQVMKFVDCSAQAITSHYPFLENPEPGYEWILTGLNRSGSAVIALTEPIKQSFINYGGQEDNIYVMPFGIEGSDFKFKKEQIKYPNRSIYLSKIEPRKRQSLFQGKELGIDFAGNLNDGDFNSTSKEYIGVWKRGEVTNNLTEYASMILLSLSEGHARVCIEGLIAGLGLVVSEFATAHLDLSKPFITVIPEEKIEDIEYLKKEIEKNRETSLRMREEIRQYCLDNFVWSAIVKRYENIIEQISKS